MNILLWVLQVLAAVGLIVPSAFHWRPSLTGWAATLLAYGRLVLRPLS